MDTTFVEPLKKFAETMLPPATVMLIECAGDRTGDPVLLRLLDEVEEKGLKREALCTEPYDTIVFDDRVLLLCHGCPRMETLPRIAGIGYGSDAEEAERNALYALTLPLDHPNTRYKDCIAAQKWGEGPIRFVRLACIINRVAYTRYPETKK